MGAVTFHMPVKIFFPGTTYSKNKAAIKASFPRSCKWDTKGRKGWFGKNLSITAHLRSGEPGTLYLEGEQEAIDSVVEACKEIVDTCQVEIVESIPDFETFSPAERAIEKIKLIDPRASMIARIRNERAKMEACGMSEDFIKKWIAIIEKEYRKKIE